MIWQSPEFQAVSVRPSTSYELSLPDFFASPFEVPPPVFTGLDDLVADLLFNSVFLRLADPYAPFIVLVAFDTLAFLLLAFDLALFFVFALLLDFGDAFLGAIMVREIIEGLSRQNDLKAFEGFEL